MQQLFTIIKEKRSHIYDVSDHAKLSKIKLEVKEGNVVYGHSCDVETNITYGLGGCSVPQPQISNDANTEEYTEMKTQ